MDCSNREGNMACFALGPANYLLTEEHERPVQAGATKQSQTRSILVAAVSFQVPFPAGVWAGRSAPLHNTLPTAGKTD